MPLNPNIERLQNELAAIQAAHKSAFLMLRSLESSVLAGANFTEAQLVDIAFICREVSKLHDDIRKEYNQVMATANRIACLSWTTKQVSDPQVGPTIRGDFATGTPDVKMVPSFPKKGTPEYEQFAKALGISDEALRCEVFHIHWPNAVDYVSKCIADGATLPPGIDPKTLKAMQCMILEELDAKMTLRGKRN